jgi:hypothetical protein
MQLNLVAFRVVQNQSLEVAAVILGGLHVSTCRLQAFAALVSRLYVGLSIPLRGIQIFQIPGDHAGTSTSSVLQKSRCESVGSDVKKHCTWCQRLARPRVT